MSIFEGLTYFGGREEKLPHCCARSTKFEQKSGGQGHVVSNSREVKSEMKEGSYLIQLGVEITEDEWP